MSKPLTSRFNLIDEDWIPVAYLDGSFSTVSLRTLFNGASGIAQIGGDIPQQAGPILRLCLAILYRAHTEYCTGGAEGNALDMTSEELLDWWQEIWDAGELDMAVIDEYLDRWHDRFCLLGDRPFLQVADLCYLSKDKQYDSILAMVGDVPKPDKFLFSMRSKAASGEISFAEAARWLLFCQSYDCAGTKTPVEGNAQAKKGKAYAPKGLPGTGWLGSVGLVYVEGRSLFETLMLNWTLYDKARDGAQLLGAEGDIAPWERSGQIKDVTTCRPCGPVGLFGVCDRRIRLVPNEDGDAIVGCMISYGDIVDPLAVSHLETMTAWYESKPKQKALGLSRAPLMPKGHNFTRALWRGLGPLLTPASDTRFLDLRPGVIRWIEELEDHGVAGLPRTFKIHAQGAEYGTQSSVITNTYEDEVDIGDLMVRGDSFAIGLALDVVRRMDRAILLLGDLARDVEEIAGARSGSSVRVATGIKERAYFELEPIARCKLRDFAEGVEPLGYCAAWCKEVEAHLKSMARRFVSGCAASRFERLGSRSVAETERIFNARVASVLQIAEEDKKEGK